MLSSCGRYTCTCKLRRYTDHVALSLELLVDVHEHLLVAQLGVALGRLTTQVGVELLQRPAQHLARALGQQLQRQAFLLFRSAEQQHGHISIVNASLRYCSY